MVVCDDDRGRGTKVTWKGITANRWRLWFRKKLHRSTAGTFARSNRCVVIDHRPFRAEPNRHREWERLSATNKGGMSQAAYAISQSMASGFRNRYKLQRWLHRAKRTRAVLLQS
jgi:hypothetical protein